MAEHQPGESSASDGRHRTDGAGRRRRLAALALALGAVAVAATALAVPGTATAAPTLPSECSRGYDDGTVRCSYETPGPGRFTVPAGVTSITVGGVGGGGGKGGSVRSNPGGDGDFAPSGGGTVTVRAGDTYEFVVGTRGRDAAGASRGAGGDGVSPGAPGGAGNSAGGAGGGGGGASSVTGPGIAWVIGGGGGGGGAGANQQGAMGTEYSGAALPAEYGINATVGGAGGGGGGGVPQGEHGISAVSPGYGGGGGEAGQSQGPYTSSTYNTSDGEITFVFTDPDLAPPTTTPAPPTTTTPAPPTTVTPSPGVSCRGTTRTADLCVTVGGPASMALGRTSTITTTVTNRGTQVARDVTTTVVIPGSLRPAAGPLTFRVASLAPAQSRSYTVPVTAARVMPNNVVQVNAASRTPEPVLRNNFATASTTVTR